MNPLVADATELRAAYPAGALDQFQRLAQAHDPEGKFRNALLKSQLEGEGSVADEYAS